MSWEIRPSGNFQGNKHIRDVRLVAAQYFSLGHDLIHTPARPRSPPDDGDMRVKTITRTLSSQNRLWVLLRTPVGTVRELFSPIHDCFGTFGRPHRTRMVGDADVNGRISRKFPGNKHMFAWKWFLDICIGVQGNLHQGQPTLKCDPGRRPTLRPPRKIRHHHVGLYWYKH